MKQTWQDRFEEKFMLYTNKLARLIERILAK